MSLLAAALAGVLVLIGLAGVGASQLVEARFQAQNAADAAALAAASATFTDGRPSSVAAALARANGAELVGCVCRFDPTPRRRAVEVRVVVHASVPFFGQMGVYATARAEFEPLGALPVP